MLLKLYVFKVHVLFGVWCLLHVVKLCVCVFYIVFVLIGCFVIVCLFKLADCGVSVFFWFTCMLFKLVVFKAGFK